MNAPTCSYRRPATPEDRPHLLSCCAATRPDFMTLGLHSEQFGALVEIQFDSQQADYARRFPQAVQEIVLTRTGDPTGMIWTDERTGELRILDGAILPSFQRNGLGNALLLELTRQAASSGRRVTIHLEIHGGAVAFFEKRGFRIIEETPSTFLMEWVSPENGILSTF